jgi:hypothetical protein
MQPIELSREAFTKMLHLKISGLEYHSWPEDILHAEWKILEEAAHDVFGNPWQLQWDYALPDWPTNIPLFSWVLNNRKLCDSLALCVVQGCLSDLTFDWHIRLECYDMIRDNQMVGGSILGEALVTRDSCRYWQADEFSFRRDIPK